MRTSTITMEFIEVRDDPAAVFLSVMLSSPIHRQLTVAEIVTLITPAIKHRAYRFIRCNNEIVGYLIYARVAAHVHNDLLNSSLSSLTMEAWMLGSNSWIIDVVVPSWARANAAAFWDFMFAVKEHIASGAVHMLVSEHQLLTNVSSEALRRLTTIQGGAAGSPNFVVKID